MNAILHDRPLRFLHSADLHLDAAFKGISSDAPAPVRAALKRATFTAFARLIAAGCALRPDFVVLAGDIYNYEDGSLRAQLTLRDGCLKLQEAGVRVFIAHGNHDPYSKRSTSIQLPENVTVFGPDTVEIAEVYRSAQLVAVVHGISHATDKERKPLARKFSRSLHDAFQVGVLHCTLDTVASSDMYAPAMLKDLISSGLDYWALGHIHAPQVVSRRPYVVYPGSIQGLHINEQGRHGCMLAEVSADGTVSLAQLPLAPVLWQSVDVDITHHATLDSLDDALFACADRCMETIMLDHDNSSYGDSTPLQGSSTGLSDSGAERQASGQMGAVPLAHALHGVIRPEPTQGIILRITLTGRGVLDAALRKPGAAADLLERLRDGLSSQAPFIWVKDIELACRPEVDMAIQRNRPDLLGEALRVSQTIRNSAEPHAEQALTGLFDKPKLRKIIPPPDTAELAQLLEEAELLCMDMLEADQ